MKPKLSLGKVTTVIAYLSLLLFVLSCTTVPLTERRQLAFIPASQINTLSFEQYNQFLAQHQVVTGTAEAQMVKRVGERVRKAVEDYLRQEGRTEIVEGYEWEFNLVKDRNVNAFAMPGGKVVVFTGILPIAQDEAGLATVIGHEIAHVVAGHGNERMSQALLTQLGGVALSAALASKPAQTRELFMQAFGLGAQVGVLMPYGRLQETESDELGLIFMAMAGYDPREAVNFWQRMEARGGGGAPEFLSTHPSPGNRIENIQNQLPKALTYYRPK